ncbi:hypothetical protein Dimus_029177, partial [Dionaea muscipula]
GPPPLPLWVVLDADSELMVADEDAEDVDFLVGFVLRFLGMDFLPSSPSPCRRRRQVALLLTPPVGGVHDVVTVIRPWMTTLRARCFWHDFGFPTSFFSPELGCCFVSLPWTSFRASVPMSLPPSGGVSPLLPVGGVIDVVVVLDVLLHSGFGFGRVSALFGVEVESVVWLFLPLSWFAVQ